MGVGRGLYILFFPLALTLAGLVLAIVTFFSGYEHATGLRNIHYMTLDLGGMNLGGNEVSQALNSANISTVYTIGTNGWCTGNSKSDITKCVTPHEPFYFSFEEILDEAGYSSLMNALPDEVQKYNTVSKGATYALWGAFLAAIVLTFLQLLFGIFAICSHVAGRFAEFFATLAFLAALIGAGLATGIYSVYTNKINNAGSSFGVKATVDQSGLGLAWATAAALLAADLFYVIASCCCVSRRTKYITVPDKGEY